MAGRDRQVDRLQIPLMFAFRDAFEKKDAEKREDVRIDGERVISERNSIRRRGTEESLLKRDLSIDLGRLVDTIDLDSVIGLEGLDYVRKSVLNYGLYDLTHVVMTSDSMPEVMANLKRALLVHEPRLNPETLVITRTEEHDEVNQRARFNVRAELICSPLDIPIEFVAEVDSASGKVAVTRPAGSA